MTYKETLHYMYSQLPMFQRIGSAAYKADLNNTIAICNLLDNPQNKFKAVHIAGTNGKGSTSHMLAAILQQAGYKVGLYTSPHLKDFRERIQINGQFISKSFVTNFIGTYKAGFEKIQPSFFEMTVGMAFQYFAHKRVDIAIIETGLGGRLDSTNVITPLVSVITNISMDHTNLLGNTLKKIATEKAGIIKPDIPVVIGETQEETENVFKLAAKKNNAPIHFADKLYACKKLQHVSIQGKSYLNCIVYRQDKVIHKQLYCELNGTYQRKNIPTVLTTCEQLTALGFRLTTAAIRKGIKTVIAQTNLYGRWQTLNKRPLIIADTGHNEAGITEVVRQLKQTSYAHLHIVLGMVNDKDITSILKLLPKKANYYFCKANIPRGLNAETLQTQAAKAGLSGKVCGSVKNALKQARAAATKSDLIFIGGSTFVVAEAI